MSSQESDIPSGWRVKHSTSHNRPYYINIYTNKSQWEKPTRPAEPEKKGSSVEKKGSSSSSEKTIRASHILIKHRHSRNPRSWRQDNITRSKERAIEKLKEIREEILKAPDQEKKFAEIAAVMSDCSSARKKGDLGPFGRGKMQKSFEKAAFSLAVGEISDIVESDSGVHIILRTE